MEACLGRGQVMVGTITQVQVSVVKVRCGVEKLTSIRLF